MISYFVFDSVIWCSFHRNFLFTICFLHLHFCLMPFPWWRNFIGRRCFTRIVFRNDFRLFFREIRVLWSNARLYLRVRSRSRDFERVRWLYLFRHTNSVLLNSTGFLHSPFTSANKTSHAKRICFRHQMPIRLEMQRI